jgi:hypothetical protein
VVACEPTRPGEALRAVGLEFGVASTAAARRFSGGLPAVAVAAPLRRHWRLVMILQKSGEMRTEILARRKHMILAQPTTVLTTLGPQREPAAAASPVVRHVC